MYRKMCQVLGGSLGEEKVLSWLIITNDFFEINNEM